MPFYVFAKLRLNGYAQGVRSRTGRQWTGVNLAQTGYAHCEKSRTGAEREGKRTFSLPYPKEVCMTFRPVYKKHNFIIFC